MKYAVNVDIGSVFVYRDSITGILDTFNVTSNSGVRYLWSNQNSYDEDVYKVEYMNYEMSSLKWQPDTTKWTILLGGGSYGIAMASIKLGEQGPLFTYSDYRARFYSEPFISDSTNAYIGPGQGFESQMNEGQYPRYTLHGKEYLTVFENVHTYQNTFKASSSQKDTTIYYQTRTLFSQDSGLIKFSIRTEKEYRVKELIYSYIKRKYPV